MPKPIIQVENLGKSYALGSKEPKHGTLQEAIVGAFRSPGKRLRELQGKAEDAESEFWALRDISFNIERGEVVGVIGRNGAGKSTLLKILSRITEPTTGRAILRGRVASLLEVGTGFHAELSGRENIYLNGSILGLTKKEIDRKFDEIVDFAEVEKFLDTPVKRYSSGMYVRLAFAVAAHLEPEILIVDEVLAVGDVQFQKKCLGKMQDVSKKDGRTVMFVSHNMAAISQLTSRSIYLKDGSVELIGDTSSVVTQYLKCDESQSLTVAIVENQKRQYTCDNQLIRFKQIAFHNKKDNLFCSDENIELCVSLVGHADLDHFRISLTIFRRDEIPVGSVFSKDDLSITNGSTEDYHLALHDLRLAEGSYHLGIAVGTGNDREGHTDFDVVLDVLPFTVLAPENSYGVKSYWAAGWGSIRFPTPFAESIG